MSKFTKDVWTADDMGEYVFAHGFDMMICQMRGWGDLKAQGLSDNEAIDVQKANARLIAAAPEMYEELIFAITALRGGDTYDRKRADKIEALLDRIDGKEVQA